MGITFKIRTHAPLKLRHVPARISIRVSPSLAFCHVQDELRMNLKLERHPFRNLKRKGFCACFLSSLDVMCVFLSVKKVTINEVIFRSLLYQNSISFLSFLYKSFSNKVVLQKK